MTPVSALPSMTQKRCFVIMPFRTSLDDIFLRIRKVAASIDCHCWRADDNTRAGDVVRMIIDDIKRADVIIADLTDRNANVFYETAIAHCLKAPHQVILLAQNDSDVPFDLRALRYLRYDNNVKGRQQLEPKLGDFLRQALDASPGELLETIEGCLERTRRIVAECEAWLKTGEPLFKSLVVRIHAGLSSLAIDERELRIGDNNEYSELLLRERNVMRALLERGAEIRAILSPPVQRTYLNREVIGRLEYRFERLNRVLDKRSRDPEDQVLLSKNCKFVLSPFQGNNIIIFGDTVLYEGIKSSLGRGYELTMRSEHRELIAARIRAFDTLFEDSEAYTLDQFGKRLKGSTAVRLRGAMQRGLAACRTRMNSTPHKPSSY
jgi:hypothetical protein